jgi:hypothetical protein
MHGALTRSADSGFFVAFGESSGWQAGHALALHRKLLQAPEADRVIARTL